MADLNTSITKNSLLTEAVGQAITEADRQVNSDWANLHPDTFKRIYGDDVFNSKLQEQRAIEQLQGDILQSQSRTELEAVTDATKNIIGGAVTGIGDVASLGTNILGLEGLSEGIARVTNQGREFFDDLGSDAEKAQGRVYSREIEGLNNRLDREYNEDIALGKSDFEASLSRFGKEALGSIDSAFRTGQAHKIVAQGLGSFGTDVLLTGGIGAVAKGTAKVGTKVAPNLLAKVASSPAYNSRVANKLKDAAPWMASVGIQEAGSVFTDQLVQGLDTSIEDLRANSPLFNERVNDLLNSREAKNLQEAEQMAREDLAFDAAESAALKTGIAATALGYATRGMAKPFERGNKSLQRFIGEALTEVPEESLSEGAGQLAQNKATRDYLDQNQTLTEGLGQAVAEGGIGGLGMVGLRAPGAVVRDTIDSALGKYNEYRTNRNQQYQTTQEASYKNLDTLKESEQTSGIANDLESVAERIKGQLHTDVDSDVDNEFNYQESLDNLSAISSIENNFKAQKTTEEQSKAFTNTANNLKTEALKPLKQRADLAMQRISGKDTFANVDVQSVANYIAGLSIAKPKKADEVVKSLPEPVQLALKTGNYHNPMVQSAIQNLFLSEVSQQQIKDTTNISQLKPKASALEATGAYRSITPEQVKNLNITQEVPLSKDFSLVLDGNQNQAYLKSSDGTYRKIPANVFNRLNENINSLPANEKTHENIIKTAINTISELPQTELISIQGQDIEVINDTFKYGDNLYELSKEAQDVFNNPESTQEQKIEALQSEFEVDTSRKAQSLDPEVLSKQNRYAERDSKGNVHIGEYDNEEVKKSFAKSFSDKFSKVVTPVKRITHVWTGNSPLQNVLDILRDEKSTQNYLDQTHFSNEETGKKVHFSNKSRLLKALFSKKSNSNWDSSLLSTVVVKDASLADRIIATLNPEGVFQQKITNNLKALERSHGKDSEVLDGILYKQDGSIDPKMLEIIRLVSPHFISQIGSYIHNLTESELRDLGIDPDIQGDSFTSIQGFPAPMALQNLATGIRKLMGVAISNEADPDEVEQIFGQLASRTAEMLVDAGLMSVVDIPYTYEEYDPDQHKLVQHQGLLKGFTPADDFRGLFRPKADILEALLNPEYKNQVHFEPVTEPTTTLAHSDISVSAAQEKTIRKENLKSATLNLPFINVLKKIGGEIGLTNLLFKPINPEYEHLYTVKHLASEKGRELSRSLAFDYLNEAVASSETSLENLKLYFENVALRNGRIMQVGAATYQNNKLLRQMLNYLDAGPVDLTDLEILQQWKATLAQKLGVSVNNLEFSKYENLINNALNFIKDSTNNGKYSKILKGLLDETNSEVSATQAEATVNDLKDFIELFNTQFKDNLKIKDEESLNALIEVLRFNKASESEKKAFTPRIFLEIDGINDGPSNINSMYGIAVGSFTPQFLVTKFKTGMALGLDTTSQELNDPENEVSELTGSKGQNLHKEVAESKIPQLILERYIAANNRAKHSKVGKTREEAQRIKDTFISYMTLFKAIGWLKTANLNALNNLSELPSDPKDYPVVFTKDISKKLTTIIPYGSQTRGSSLQVVRELIDGLQGEISNALYSVAEEGVSPDNVKFNGVSYSEVQKALSTLFSISVSEEGIFENSRINVDTLMRGLPENFPSKSEINSTQYKKVAKERAKAERLKQLFHTDEIREFNITSAGYEFLVQNLMPVFGEPAQLAVTEALGFSAMKGARFIMEAGGLLSLIAKNFQSQELHKIKGKKLTMSDLYKIRRATEALSPTIKFKGGAKVFAEKTSFTKGTTPLYQNPNGDGAFNFYSSRKTLESASLSLGALATQGIGDATVMYYLSEFFNGNFGNVFDGHYVAPSKNQALAGESANKAVRYAQTKLPFADLYNALISVGKKLQEHIPHVTTPEGALAVALGRIAKDEFINGISLTKDEIGKANNQYEVNSFLKLTEEDKPYVTDIQQTQGQRQQNLGFSDKANADKATQARVLAFLRQLKMLTVNEKINHHVFDKLPQTYHHMSALSNTYQHGKTKDITDWRETLELVNATTNTPFNNLAELQAAYLNTKAEAQFLEVFPGDSALKMQWKSFIGTDRGNSGYRTLDATQEVILDKIFGATEVTPIRDTLNKFSKSYSSSGVLHRALNSIKTNAKHPAIFNSLYSKLHALMPKDVNVVIYSSREALPKEVRTRFTNNSQKGIYFIKDGKPTIYIIGHNGTLNIDNSKNQEVLAHEAIHVVMSQAIHAYYNEPHKLSEAQTHAFENLEALLNNFKNLQWISDEGKPAVVTRLEAILNDPNLSKEAKLDESLAYILSNGEVFEALDKAEMSKYLQNKHRKNLRNLLGELVKSAKNLWKRILNIISGSPMDKGLEFNPKDAKKYTDNLNFLGLYGANTFVALNEEFKARKKDPNRDKRLLNSDIQRNAFNLDTSRSTSGSNSFYSSLREQIFTDETFRIRAKGILSALHEKKNLGENAAKKLKEEIQNYLSYEGDLTSFVSSYLSPKEAKAFAKNAINFQLVNRLTPRQRQELARIYVSFRKALKEDFLIDNPGAALEEDFLRSRALYKLMMGESAGLKENVFDNRPKTLVEHFEKPAIFFALVQSVPEIREAVGKVFINTAKKESPNYEGDWVRKLEDAITQVNKETDANKFNDKELDKILKGMLDQTEDLNLSSYEKSINVRENLMDKVDLTVNKAISKATGISGKTVIENPQEANYVVSETARSLNNRFVSNSFLNGVIRDLFYTRTASNTAVETMLKKIKGFFDKIRKAKLEQIPEQLTKEFKHHKIDRKMLKFFDRTLGQADIGCLDDSIIQESLLSTSSLENNIHELEERLGIIAYELKDRYIAKSKQLANYLSGDRKAGHNLLTNAQAISRLLGEENLSKQPEKLVKTIDQLTTLYCLENLSKADRELFKSLFEKDSKGMEAIISQLKETTRIEQKRVGDAYENSRLKGWRPSGNQVSGLYALVPKRLVQQYLNNGYKVIGDYQASDIDASEPMVRMYNFHPHEKEFQEGIFQSISQTAFGYQISNRTRGEAYGTRIKSNRAANIIYDQFQSEKTNNGVIPLYDDSGKVMGYERAIPPEDRDLLEKDRDLFSAIAQYQVRQEREEIADAINLTALQEAKRIWDEATPEERKTQFIDVLHSNGKVIQEAVKRLDQRTIDNIKQTFGNRLYLKRDEVHTFLGTYRMSVLDIWDNTFILPKPVEDAIVKILEMLFHENAKHYLANAEVFLKGGVSFVRDTIINRSGIIPIINAASNAFILWTTFGIPPQDLVRLYKEAFRDAKEYDKRFHRAISLQYKAVNAKDSKEKKRLLEEYENNKLQMINSPIFKLAEQGEYSTISNEGVEYDEVDFMKQKVDGLVNLAIDKIGMGTSIKTAMSEVLMLKGSNSYNFMVQMTNYGDWLAKIVGYRYLTEHGNKWGRKLNEQEAINSISSLFVDYDQFIGRERDWANRVGLTWFTTFKYRITRAAIMGMMYNPTLNTVGAIFASIAGLGTPVTDNMLTKVATGDIWASTGWDMMTSGLSMHPLAVILGLGK